MRDTAFRNEGHRRFRPPPPDFNNITSQPVQHLKSTGQVVVAGGGGFFCCHYIIPAGPFSTASHHCTVAFPTPSNPPRCVGPHAVYTHRDKERRPPTAAVPNFHAANTELMAALTVPDRRVLAFAV